MKKISIIVPIYNVENYIQRCLNSLITQTLKEIEIIIINDGSTDNSQTVIDEYVDNVLVKSYQKENGGLSDARNYGINQAIGEYILFIDSDDYILQPDACENLYNIAKKNDLDILKFGYYDQKKHENKLIHESKSNKIYTGKEYLKQVLKDEILSPVAWNSLYKNEFLKNNNLQFKKGICHEDELWTPKVILLTNKIMQINEVYYYYTYNPNSITTKKDKTKNAIDIINICKELEKIYSELDDLELKALLMDSLVDKYLQAFVMGKMYKKELRKYIDKLFVKGKSYTLRNKLKVLLFYFNMRLYYLINSCKNNIIN